MDLRRRIVLIPALALVLTGAAVPDGAAAATGVELVLIGEVDDDLADRVERAVDDAEATLGPLADGGIVYLWSDLDDATDAYLAESGEGEGGRANHRSQLANGTAFATADYMFVSAEKIDDEYPHRAITVEWTMAHEYAHMLHQHAAGDITFADGMWSTGPAWLSEGAADLAAMAVAVEHGREIETSIVRRNLAHARNAAPSLSEMERSDDFQDADPNGDGDYAKGFLGAHQLASLADADAVLVDYWSERADGGSWEDDFEDVFGTSIAEFYADFDAWFDVESAPDVLRVAGTNRMATAVAVSKSLFGDRGAHAVVLARSDSFADTLAGTPLAAGKAGPLLLTPPGALDPQTANEIQRVLAPDRTVYLLGGSAALSTAVENDVRALGVDVIRLAGADRYATAVAIAEQGLGSPDTVFLATGTAFQDALIAGPAAARFDGAVLLTNGSAMPAATARYLDGVDPQRYAIGAPAADADPTATRIVGHSTRVTSYLVGDLIGNRSIVGIASDSDFADALAGGTHAALMGGPLYLTPPAALPEDLGEHLSFWSDFVFETNVFGGTAAVSPETFAALEDIVG